MKKITILVTCLVLSLSLITQTLAAETPASTADSQLLIILDASGSMNEKLAEGITRAEAAQEVLNNLVNDIPATATVGLRVYGHTSPKEEMNCKDSTLVIPIAPINKDNFTKTVNGIKSQGMTPLAYSLAKAAKDFTTSGKKVIVLVSDGLETCQGNPSQMAENLVASGINVNIHVVGFAVDDTTKEQLSTIAEKGQGEYFSAGTADELEKSLDAIFKKEITYPGQVLKGGIFYDDAVLIEPGEYKLDHDIPKATYEYFYLEVKPGQNIVASITTPDTAESNLRAGVAIIDAERKELTKVNIIGAKNEKKTIAWLSNSASEKYKYYLRLGTDMSEPMVTNTTVTLEVQDFYDADSGTDAGDNFEQAFDLGDAANQSYPQNYLRKDEFGNDTNDYFQLNVKASQTITLTVTPGSKDKLKMTLYDHLRKTLEQGQSSNEGALIQLKYNNKETDDQKIFFNVATTGSNPKDSYKIDIETTGSESGTGTETDTPDDTDTPPDENTPTDTDDQTNFTDANSTEDAGPTFDQATPIEIRDYAENAFSADDDRDVFKLDLTKDQVLTINIKPEENLQISGAFYDTEETELIKEESTQAGEELNLEYLVSATGSYYLAIDKEDGAGSYGLFISASARENNPAATSEDTNTDENVTEPIGIISDQATQLSFFDQELITGIKNLYLVIAGGGIAFLIILGIVLFTILGKKKKSPPAAGHELKMNLGGTPPPPKSNITGKKEEPMIATIVNKQAQKEKDPLQELSDFTKEQKKSEALKPGDITIEKIEKEAPAPASPVNTETPAPAKAVASAPPPPPAIPVNKTPTLPPAAKTMEVPAAQPVTPKATSINPAPSPTTAPPPSMTKDNPAPVTPPAVTPSAVLSKEAPTPSPSNPPANTPMTVADLTKPPMEGETEHVFGVTPPAGV